MVNLPAVISASNSSIKVDGETVPGLQSISYKIHVEGGNIHAIGDPTRQTRAHGQMYVTGVLRVKSAFVKFEEFMCKRKPFQLVVELKGFKSSGVEEQVGTISFDEVYINSCDFILDKNNDAISEYTFDSTRIRTKLGDQEFNFSVPTKE